MNYRLYQEIVKKNTPKSNTLKNVFFAFISGGLLGVYAELLLNIALNTLHFSDDDASFFASMGLVILSIILTFFHKYKKIAQICGAGVFLPTTGFANSLTSAAMEGRSEGLIQGIGSNIFSLAGSVICFGISISFYLANIYFFLNMWGINVWA